MRKQQKRQVKEVVSLLGNVHEGIRKAIEAGKWEEAMVFLAQCQESAIDLGEMIEESEGKGIKTVPFLENYCEKVYQIYETLDQGRTINGQKAEKTLRKALIQAENSIKIDIKVRREVVFLPYKASMWDSLESVWMAADEDPDCDAYVIPIPYYTKNPDGSFREEHYEGELYPDYVPVIRYEEYDFAGRQPDVIFIHNPYDNNNYLTSVHPFFYSKNLKQFTEKLVYIPYFILGEIEPENEKAVEGMSHFCTVPGVLYADKVIVQSEKMRQIYVNVMTEFTKGTDADKRYWEEKILGLGSPKTDKALSTHKEDVEVPDEWLKIIEKPDGSWKTIIFYNTSITALLQNGEKMLEKMRDVFRVFRENREETALLWRPHPLIRATIEAMRPHLREEYEEIVKEYRKAGWGIYDDTADVDRAIALCDGYYGDHSSLVRLCREAGKPTIIQGLERELFLETMLDGDAFFWAVSGEVYGSTLFQIDKQTWKAKYIGAADVSDCRQRKYESILEYKGKLYFIPRTSDYLDIYDPKEDSWSRYEIEKPKEDNCLFPYNSCVKYSFAFPMNDMIYFFPHTYPAIMKYNINSQKINYLYDCIDSSLYRNIREPANFSVKGFCDGQYVTFYSRSSNKILQFDMKSEKINVLEVFYENDVYDIFEYDSNYYWLIPADNKKNMIKWNVNSGQDKVANTWKKFNPKRISFQHSAVAGGYLWLLPGIADIALKLDLHTQKMEEAIEFAPGYLCPDPSNEQWKYQCIENTGDSVWAFDGSDGQLVKAGEKQEDIIRKPVVSDLKGTTNREYMELMDSVRKREHGNEESTNKQEIGKMLFGKVCG